MSHRMLSEVPYCADSAQLFEAIADRPWAMFLDSGRPYVQQGRYDILVADPMLTLTTRGPLTEIRSRNNVELSKQDPFALVRQYLEPTEPQHTDLPFCGGALGYFAYDLGRRIEQLPSSAENAEQIPEMAVGVYDWALVVDHEQQRSWLVGQGRDDRTRQRWQELLECYRNPPLPRRRRPFEVLDTPVSSMTYEDYTRAFHRIKHYIREGDCYQVNLAQRFHVNVDGSLWQAYKSLRKMNPAPFGCYLNTPYAQILSSSPERFLRIRGGEVETKPVKGTRPRSTDADEDRSLAEELRLSTKDRAENVMIVDLLRNDLSKTCAFGTVRVRKLFDVESFATVHHLVSTITGRLDSASDALECLRGCFPGGSITGAPKLRAMEIIEELEPYQRGIYCGSVGYVGFDGAMDSNIAIRTLVHSGGRLRFWAGGGIISDSELDAEYQETFDKVDAILKLLKHLEIDHVGGEDRRKPCIG
ncbi:MAG: aminodeoxychorismate synthase component I [Gammaproteobacteria bacterium]|nr:aminodeoxychorismate synthase component I [Gammaproteobacteria bacterium]